MTKEYWRPIEPLRGRKSRLARLMACTALSIGALLNAEEPSFASSRYFADTDELELKNDENDTTHVLLTRDTSCELKLFSDARNIYPWGSDSGKMSNKWPLSDEDWKDGSLALAERIRNWKALSSEKRLASLGGRSACAQEINRAIDIKTTEERECRSQGKKIRKTDSGWLCLSDFEFAQLEQQKKQIENNKSLNYQSPLGVDGCPAGTSRYKTNGLFGLGRKDLGCMTDYEANRYNQQHLQNTINNINNNRQRTCHTNFIGNQAYTSCY